jgi:hypothetical protein
MCNDIWSRVLIGSVITSNVLRSSPWLGWLLWNICGTDDHGYVPLVSTFQSFPHSWLITDFVTRLTRRVSVVEQELLTLPDHLSSSPVFGGIRVSTEFNQCCFRWIRISQSNCSIHIKLNYLPIKPIFFANCYRKIYYNNL